MSPIENFEEELKTKERKLLESKVSKLTEEDKLQIYNDGNFSSLIVHLLK